MSYYVTREGQTYGPYTLDDLQRYVSSGNVLLTDMARADEASEWLPVAQILGVSGSATPPPVAPPAVPTAYAPPPANPYGTPVPAYGAPAIPYPNPPNLHWLVVLLITFFCGFFGFIWEVVQLVWLRKVEPQTKAVRYFILAYVIGFIDAGFFVALSSATGNSKPNTFLVLICGSIGVVSAILYILYRFAMRDSIEHYYNTVEPIGLRLGPIMTFFFGSLYFQYHFTRINDMKLASRYGGYRP